MLGHRFDRLSDEAGRLRAFDLRVRSFFFSCREFAEVFIGNIANRCAGRQFALLHHLREEFIRRGVAALFVRGHQAIDGFVYGTCGNFGIVAVSSDLFPSALGWLVFSPPAAACGRPLPAGGVVGSAPPIRGMYGTTGFTRFPGVGIASGLFADIGLGIFGPRWACAIFSADFTATPCGLGSRPTSAGAWCRSRCAALIVLLGFQ